MAKKRSKAKKGGRYERAICKMLSLWWTQDQKEPDDNIFWRSSNSGGRATVRGRKGKRTIGHSSDLIATNPIGQPLMDLCTIELKKGYAKDTIACLLDAPDNAAQQKWEQWHQQVTAAQELAGTPYWMIIHCRSQREDIVYIEKGLFDRLDGLCPMSNISPLLTLDTKIRTIEKVNNRKIYGYNFENAVGMQLRHFLEEVDREVIESALEQEQFNARS